MCNRGKDGLHAHPSCVSKSVDEARRDFSSVLCLYWRMEKHSLKLTCRLSVVTIKIASRFISSGSLEEW